MTIDDAPATTNMVDVFFLADTTGSMGSVLNAVKTSASSILTTASGLGNVAFGIGEYKDSFDSFRYRLNQSITTNTTDAQTGISQWVAGGGGDGAEGQLPSLKDAAEGAGWRAGSTRILVWFGDAPGHDPRDGVSEAQAIAALQAQNIEVQAIGTNSGVSGDLNADPTIWGSAGGSADQANRITAATGGAYIGGINDAAIVAAITDAISTAVSTYSNVSLDLSEVAPGVSASCLPAGGHSGSFSRAATETFDFDCTFTGVTAGVHSFNIYATVDGGRVATEADEITVTGATAVPAPPTVAILLVGLTALGFFGASRRSGRSA